MCFFLNQKKILFCVFIRLIGYKVSVFYTKFISVLGNRLWRDERIQTFILCLFEAGQKTIPSILMYHRPSGEYLTLKYRRNAAQQGQQATERIHTHEYVSLRTKIQWYNFLDGIQSQSMFCYSFGFSIVCCLPCLVHYFVGHYMVITYTLIFQPILFRYIFAYNLDIVIF